MTDQVLTHESVAADATDAPIRCPRSGPRAASGTRMADTWTRPFKALGGGPVNVVGSSFGGLRWYWAASPGRPAQN